MKEVSLKTMRWKLFLLGFVKIPMIHFVRPKIMKVDDYKMIIKIPFRRRTKNHLNSMYFGALAIGADLAAGLLVYYLSERLGNTISLAFKSTSGQFLKRPESDVYFHCEEGSFILEEIQAAKKSQERRNFKVLVKAYNTSKEEVALFDMEVSIRVK
jgi:hypothetical protein